MQDFYIAAVSKSQVGDRPFEPISGTDLAAVIKVHDNGRIRDLTSHDLQNYLITDEEAFERAHRNTATTRPVIMPLVGMIDSMLDKSGIDQETRSDLIPDGGPRVYVVTSESMAFGASMLTRSDVLDSVHKTIGEDYYILPSSVHEILAIGKSEAESVEALETMVRAVNETEVSEHEQLSYHVFQYDGVQLTIATDGTDKMATPPAMEEERLMV